MKLLVAVILVVVCMVAAESPNRAPIFQRQTAPPYQPRGWRPNGPPFNPTFNFERQELAPQEPGPSYGPPLSVSYGPPEGVITTTEVFAESTTVGTTLDLQGEDIKSGLREAPQKAEKLQNEPQAQPGPVYVVLPQGQNLLYATGLRPVNAQLVQPNNQPKDDVEEVKQPKLAPVQAVPALARIQAPVVVAKYEQAPQLVQLQQIQGAPYARFVSTLSQSEVHTPFSDSFVQVYQ